MEVRYVDPDRTGKTLFFSVRRVSDGYVYDVSDGTFKQQANVVNPKNTLTEQTGFLTGLFVGSLSTPSSTFTDGAYDVLIHDDADPNDIVIAGTQTAIKDGTEVFLDASILQTVGYDSAATVHDKLGAFTGASGDNVKDALGGMAGVSASLSVSAGEFQIITDLGQAGKGSPAVLDLNAFKEHQKKWKFKLMYLDGTPVDLTGDVVRYIVQQAKGEGQPVLIDKKSNVSGSGLVITDATNGIFELTLSGTDTDQNLGTYYHELLLDEGNTGDWQLLCYGNLTIEEGADLIPG